MSTEVQHIGSDLSNWLGHLASNLKSKLITSPTSLQKEPVRSCSPRRSNILGLNTSNPAPLRRSRSKQEKQRPASSCLHATTASNPPNQPRSTDEDPQTPQLFRRNSAPVGEHSAAARSRARYNLERRKSLSRQRSLSRSSSLNHRYESKAAVPDGLEVVQTVSLRAGNSREAEVHSQYNLLSEADEDLPQLVMKKRNSLGQPNMTSRDLARLAAQKRPVSSILPTDTRIENLRSCKAQNRLSLPIIPASPIDVSQDTDADLARFAEKFGYNTVFGSTAPRGGARPRSRRLTRVFDNLVAQNPPVRRTVPSMDPAILAPKVKSLATIVVTSKNVERAARDIMHSTISAKSQLRITLSITTSEVQNTTLESRPSTSWSILKTGGTSPMLSSFASKWHVEVYGRRRFQNAAGFWG